MPKFKYRVRDTEGKTLEGAMDAADGRDLRKKLDEKNFFIIDFAPVKQVASAEGAGPLSFGTKVKLNDISVFSWQLYTMLNAGLSLVNSLAIIMHQTKHATLKKAVRQIKERVEGGSSFAEALKEHPKVFTRLYIQMVNAGEIGGVLDEMLKRLAIFYEKQAEVKARLRSAMIYPVVLLIVSFGVVIFLITYVLPQFAVIFADIEAEVPLPTQMLLNLSALLKDYWLLMVGGIIGLFFAFRFYIATPPGRLSFDYFQLQIPGVGDLIRKSTASRFTQAFSTLVGSGIPILTALDVVIDTVGNTAIARGLKDVTVKVGEGKSIAQPLGESKVFPEMVVSMIKVGEETGSLAEIMVKVSEFYDREVDHAIRNFTKVIEPVLIVFMTIVIGFISVSIFLPLADIMQGLHI